VEKRLVGERQEERDQIGALAGVQSEAAKRRA
jgi:hypothetical protein